MRAWIYAVFLLSGFAALLYQIVWQRALYAIYGINVESVTMVVTAFMLGLGLGSLGGGVVSKDPKRPVLLMFSLVELGIGLFGALEDGIRGRDRIPDRAPALDVGLAGQVRVDRGLARVLRGLAGDLKGRRGCRSRGRDRAAGSGAARGQRERQPGQQPQGRSTTDRGETLHRLDSSQDMKGPRRPQ